MLRQALQKTTALALIRETDLRSPTLMVMVLMITEMPTTITTEFQILLSKRALKIQIMTT